MKGKKRNLLLFSSKNKSNPEEGGNKIELVSCLNGGMHCQVHLEMINKKFSASNQYIRNKEYFRSIEELKNAIDITGELSDSPCSECARLFRKTITQSLENIQFDLSEMSHGLHGQRYEGPYRMATVTLEELRGKL